MEPSEEYTRLLTRRQLFGRTAAGIGTVALASILNPELFAAPLASPSGGYHGALKGPHFPVKAKRVIYLFQSGAPSHIDLFDWKPEMQKMDAKLRKESQDYVQSLEIIGATATYDALEAAYSLGDVGTKLRKRESDPTGEGRVDTIILLTDGLPTAHFQGQHLFLLYPPDPATEEATMREGAMCRRDGITINIFMLPSWWQSSEDIGFAHRLAERTGGRVFFTGGGDVDRFVLWDYVSHRRKIIG